MGQRKRKSTVNLRYVVERGQDLVQPSTDTCPWEVKVPAEVLRPLRLGPNRRSRLNGQELLAAGPRACHPQPSHSPGLLYTPTPAEWPRLLCTCSPPSNHALVAF